MSDDKLSRNEEVSGGFEDVVLNDAANKAIAQGHAALELIFSIMEQATSSFASAMGEVASAQSKNVRIKMWREVCAAQGLDPDNLPCVQMKGDIETGFKLVLCDNPEHRNRRGRKLSDFLDLNEFSTKH